jgi:hypothetical protein
MSIAILTIFALSTLIQSFLEVVNIIEKTLNFVHSFLSTLKDVLNTINTHLKLCVENKKQSEKFFLLIGSTNSKPSKMTYFEKCVLKTIFIQTTIQDSLESQITIQDSLESQITIQDSLESQTTIQDSLESQITIQDSLESQITIQDSLESQITIQDSLESPITIQDSLESPITIQDSLESKNSEYSKFTVKKARELISQTISKNKSLVAPKKSAKKQILINWLTDNL